MANPRSARYAPMIVALLLVTASGCASSTSPAPTIGSGPSRAPIPLSSTPTHAWGFRSGIAEAEAFSWGPTAEACEVELAALKRKAQQAKLSDVFGACQPMTVQEATYGVQAQGVATALNAVVGSWWGFTVPAPGYGQAANGQELCEGLRKQNAVASPCIPVWVIVSGAR